MAETLSSTCTLYQGDCLEVMPTLAPGSVAMVFADLPYGLLKWHDWDRRLALDKFWQSCRKVTFKQSAVILTASMRFAAHCIATNAKDFRYDLVWAKLRPSNFVQAKSRPLNYHEHVLLFATEMPTYNAQMLDAEERRYVEKSPRVQMTPYVNPFYKQMHKKICRNSQGPMHPKSILNNLNKTKKDGHFHPTQKPVALLEWLVKTYTNPGDTILDPVFGSCTTGVACARLGRNFIGIEKDPGYFQVGKDRVNAERAGLGLGEAVAHV